MVCEPGKAHVERFADSLKQEEIRMSSHIVKIGAAAVFMVTFAVQTQTQVNTISAKCANRWPNDLQMQKRCSGIPDDPAALAAGTDISATCTARWPNDPQMQGRCTDRERSSRMVTSAAPAVKLPARSHMSAGQPSCYLSSIMNPSPFMGNDGEIFKLSDGSIWEVKFEYEYLYEYYPQVLVCPGRGKLTVKGKTLNIQLISASSALPSLPHAAPHSTAGGANVIESRIDGEFTGWSGDTIFKLRNGQIWQQSSYA